MNKIIIKGLTFDDMGIGQGKIIDGKYHAGANLSQAELEVGTMSITVRYPVQGEPDTSPTTWATNTPCTYYQDDKIFCNYYLSSVKRTGKYVYQMEFVDAIGLLETQTFDGNIYKDKKASELIAEIVNRKFSYSIDPFFDKVLLSGYLPIADSRSNLMQVLFASNCCVKVNELGNPYFTTISQNTSSIIPDNRVMDNGDVDYDKAVVDTVQITQHDYQIDTEQGYKTVYEDYIKIYKNVTTKTGAVVRVGVIEFNQPVDIGSISGASRLDDDLITHSTNTIYVYATTNIQNKVIVKGFYYKDNTSVVIKSNVAGATSDHMAQISNATLISLNNSNVVSSKVLSYYGINSTLNTGFILEDEKPNDNVVMSDPFGNTISGIVKSIDGKFGKSVHKVDSEVITDYYPPVLNDSVLTSLDIITPPDKTEYKVGEFFDLKGMFIQATYKDGTKVNVTNLVNYSPNLQLKANDNKIIFSYTENSVTKTCEQAITVINSIVGIYISNLPSKMSYQNGDTLDVTGMVVQAKYADGSYREITEYTYSPTEVSEDNKTITVEYSGFKTYFDVTIGEESPLALILIMQQPTTVDYQEGEFFQPSGMTVKAYLEDGSNFMVDNWDWEPKTALTKENTEITVSYTRGSITKTTKQKITIIYATGIQVTNPPLTTVYYEDNRFNPIGMEVSLLYTNGKLEKINSSEYSITPNVLKYGDKEILISYNYKGQIFTTTYPITVNFYPYDYTKYAVLYTEGIDFFPDINVDGKLIPYYQIQDGKPINYYLKDLQHHNFKIVLSTQPIQERMAGGTRWRMRNANQIPTLTEFKSMIKTSFENGEWIYPSDTSQAPYKEVNIHLPAKKRGYFDLSLYNNWKELEKESYVDFYIKTGLTKEEAENKYENDIWDKRNQASKNLYLENNPNQSIQGFVGGKVIEKELYIKNDEPLNFQLVDDQRKGLPNPTIYNWILKINNEVIISPSDGKYYPEGYQAYPFQVSLGRNGKIRYYPDTKEVDGKVFTYAGGDGGKLGESGKQGENNGEKGTAPIVNEQIVFTPSSGKVTVTINKGGDGGYAGAGKIYYPSPSTYKETASKPFLSDSYNPSSLSDMAGYGQGSGGSIFGLGWGGVGEISLDIHATNNFGLEEVAEQLYDKIFPAYYHTWAVYDNNKWVNQGDEEPIGRAKWGLPVAYIYYS